MPFAPDYTISGNAASPQRVIRLCGEHDLPLPEIDGEYCLVSVQVDDWFRRLSPWAAPPAFGTEPFTGGGQETLAFLTDELLPALDARLGPGGFYLLTGYSLAGLFALWAGYESDRFAGIAAVSPSVWYPCWTDYEAAGTPKAGKIYLSLGDREEKTRNSLMSQVGDAIRLQARLLNRDGVASVLEWNPGNHFRDSEKRCARGIEWLLQQLSVAEI